MSDQSETSPEDFIQVRRKKREKMMQEDIDPYPHKFVRTHTAQEATEAFDPDSDEKLGEEVRVAGRVVAERLHGGAAFLDLQDQSGQIQVYLSGEYMDEEEQFDQFDDYWDIGDVVGIEGELFETNEGEVSVLTRKATFLSKGLRPLPEKFHGLQDKELRYRKRYLDLISNDDVRETFRMRSQFISVLRNQLEAEGFMEVETPIMQSIPGGAEAEPFVTHHNALDRDLYLRIAPELYLKRLIVGGFEKVFELNRNFRNEGISTQHNPEFTMLELYEAYVDYREIMELTERVMSTIVEELTGSTLLEYQGKEIDWSRPWNRRSLISLVEEETGMSVSLDDSAEAIYDRALENGIEVEPCDEPGAQIVEIFEQVVEQTLQQPTFVVDYPSSLSPLAKNCPDQPALSERFELFVGGFEVGNAYSELNDPQLQRDNFEDQIDDSEQLDEDYLEALEYGMPPAGGLGLGIDRLTMLLTNSASIRDVILFPTLREPRQ